MNFGLPYMGSKSGIAKEICKIFPKAANFYDLFGGGFSVTHAMMVYRGKSYKNFHFNEIRKGINSLIKDSINGKYSYDNFKPEFIPREKFFAEKENNPYIKLCWSFGNYGKTYIFSKEIEPYKKAMHSAIVFNRFNSDANLILGLDSFPASSSITQRRLMLTNKIFSYKKNGAPEIFKQFQGIQQLEKLERLEQLEQLERLQQLQQLQQLERLNFYNTSYEKVRILPDSIVYCDIPYKGTAEYDKNKSFNHNDFSNWADSIETPVYISEYNISDKRFKLIKSIKKRSLFAIKTKVKFKIEKVYVNKFGFNKYYKR